MLWKSLVQRACCRPPSWIPLFSLSPSLVIFSVVAFFSTRSVYVPAACSLVVVIVASENENAEGSGSGITR